MHAILKDHDYKLKWCNQPWLENPITFKAKQTRELDMHELILRQTTEHKEKK